MEENVNFPSWIMSKIKYYLSLAFFLSALTGCNTQPISPAQSVGEYYVQATQLSDKPVVVVYQPDLNIYYPSFSMRANETGSVEVSAKIDEIGGIYDAIVVKSSSNPRLDRAAITLAGKYSFKPYVTGDSLRQNHITFNFYFQKKLPEPTPQVQGRPSYPAVTDKNEAIVRIIVDEFGAVDSVVILQSTGNKKLDNEALKMAKNQKFRSFIINGSPQKISTDFKVTFGGAVRKD